MTGDVSGHPPDSGFRLLLARLDPDPDRAGAEFERLRRTLRRFFDWRGASWPDECSDETLDRIARKLDEGVEVLDVAGFARGIARLVLLERSRSDARSLPLDDGFEALAGRQAGSRTERNDDETVARALDLCLDGLQDGGRELVLSYYAQADGRSKIESRQRIARRLHLTDNALRSRMQRLRDRLEDCVRQSTGNDARGGGLRR